MDDPQRRMICFKSFRLNTLFLLNNVRAKKKKKSVITCAGNMSLV